MILQLIHQAGAQSTDLLRCCNSQKDNFRESLCGEGSEHAPTKDLRLAPLLSSEDNHGFMLPVHGELNDIIPGHPRELLGNDILEINEVPHGLQCPKKLISRNVSYLSLRTTWNSKSPCSSSFLTLWSRFTKPKPAYRNRSELVFLPLPQPFSALCLQ